MKEMLRNRLNALYGKHAQCDPVSNVRRVLAQANQATEDYKADIAEEWARMHGFDPMARKQVPDCMFAGYIAFANEHMKSRRTMLRQLVEILREDGHNVTLGEDDYIRYNAE